MKPERVEKLNSIGFPWTATTVDQDHCAEADDEGDESDVEYDTTEEHCAEADDEGNESNVEYDTANEDLSDHSHSTRDQKPHASKSVKYSAGTKVEKVSTREKSLLLHSYHDFVSFLTLHE
jgi:hypothetical protein